jgi:hypothetical protein
MQPEPTDPTKNIPERGDEELVDFGLSVLRAMERLRENRVKQLASRVIEAALGIGREPHHRGGRQLKRSRIQTHTPCHAVIIENLQNYRPDDVQTRRENRQLMAWASARVSKYLQEGCQLHGLYLREVPAAYTSRHDSRTGAPGVRCKDISVEELLAPHWSVRRAVNALDAKTCGESADFDTRLAIATIRAQERCGTACDRYLVELFNHWRRRSQSEYKGRSVRIPARGGEIFATADADSPILGGLQADLNAAANIGLKAICDPDWPGAWSYLPVDGKTFVPVAKSVGGSQAFDLKNPLQDPPKLESAETPGKKARAAGKESDAESIVNLWRFVSPLRLTEETWMPYAEFRPKVEYRVIQLLRTKAGLPKE